MPLVRIDLRQGKTEQYKKALADGVHRALVEGAGAPADDRFQIVTEHPPGGIIFDANYLAIPRNDDIVIVQITLSAGRKLAQKKKLFQRTAELLAENPGLNPNNLMINLVEVAWENWSFGNGEAQYAL
ncbi:MAG TPA: tautomerase family protein [Candidatus Binatia bacterium]|nr:tautomerase family protein [Candidatus Binatia bacterium]